MIFGPSATRAANLGPVARVSEFGESLLLLLNHVCFQALYLASNSWARAGDVVLSLLYRSSAYSTAAALGGGTGAKGSMPGAFLSDEDDEDRREFGGEEEDVDDGCGGAVFSVGDTAGGLAAGAQLLLAGPVFPPAAPCSVQGGWGTTGKGGSRLECG